MFVHLVYWLSAILFANLTNNIQRCLIGKNASFVKVLKKAETNIADH